MTVNQRTLAKFRNGDPLQDKELQALCEAHRKAYEALSGFDALYDLARNRLGEDYRTLSSYRLARAERRAKSG